MPLVRAAATTAVIAGTAGAVHHHQANKWEAQEQAAYESQQQAAMQQQMYEQQMQMQQMQQQMAQQQAPAQAAPAAAAANSPMMDQLNQLAQMHAAGVLDDAEFAAAKQRLLAGG
jgi:hypothetical protein